MMKKIYSLGLIAFTALSISAQKNATVTSTPVNSIFTSAEDVERSTIDTLQTGADWSVQAAIFGVGPDPNAGYVCGSNTYGDKQKVQIFYPSDISFNPAPFTVIGAMYWFGGKTVSGTPGNVAFRTYRIDGANGTTSTATGTAVCPNTVVVSDNVSMTAIDTANIQIHNFSAPSVFNTMVSGQYPFGVGFDVTGINDATGDTVGLVSTADENYDAIFPESAWEQWSDNSWWSIPHAWNNAGDLLNIELAIFPIAFNTLSLEETVFLNGVRAFVPSPFANSTTFTYELLYNTPSVAVNIIDMSGHIIYNKTITTGAEAGKYTLDFDGSSLTSGTYIMSVQAGQGRVATKFVKQ